jgi:hypothetical protein
MAGNGEAATDYPPIKNIGQFTKLLRRSRKLLDDRFPKAGDGPTRGGILRVGRHPENISMWHIVAFSVPGGPGDLGI